MMDEKILKRVSDSIADGSESIDGELSKEADAAAQHEEISLLEQGLREWGFEEPPRQYWKSFGKRMTPRLGVPDDGEDMLVAPLPDEPSETTAAAALEEVAEPEEEDDGLGALAALAGRSTLAPADAFSEEPAVSPTPEKKKDSVIDLGELKAEVEASEKPAAVAAASGAPMGSSPAPAMASAAGAPVAAQAPEQKSSGAIYAIVAVLVVALGVVGYFAFVNNGDEPPESMGSGEQLLAAAPSEPAPATAPGEPTATAPATAPDPAEPGGEEPAPGEEPAAGEEPGETEEGGIPEAGSSSRSGRAARRAARAKAAAGGSQTAAPAPPPAAKAAPAPAPTPGPAATKEGATANLDALLAGATGPRKAAPTPAKRTGSAAEAVSAAVGGGGGPEMPTQPSRSQVRRAMGSVAGQVMACKSLVQSTTRVNATVNVASSGAVQSANVSGGTPQVQQCVQRAVRRARFPRFSQASFSVTYPFVLSPPE